MTKIDPFLFTVYISMTKVELRESIACSVMVIAIQALGFSFLACNFEVQN